jgi:peroxiredoxin
MLSSAPEVRTMPDPAAILPAGTPAPDFELPVRFGETVALRRFRGRPVVLVCGDQLGIYAELTGEFDRHDAVVLGISVDGIWCHAAYAESRDLPFTLLSDFEPKGAVARRYGVYDATAGVCERALFVLDRDGVIRWSQAYPILENPGADGILEALDELEPAGAR